MSATILLLLALIRSAKAYGGELPFFTTVQGSPNVTHRQNVCDRFEDFYFKRRSLPRALEGLQLHVVVGAYQGGYFNFNNETGIDPDEPGIIAVILDELARRGGFTWRESVGIYTEPQADGMTWNDTLHWSINAYDFVAGE